jgi:hypothetical protein
LYAGSRFVLASIKWGVLELDIASCIYLFLLQVTNMRFSLWSFIVDQRSRQPPVLKVDLTGKTVVVVGANTGLGFEATKHFATMNPGRLILACRSQSKGQVAVDSKLPHSFFNRGSDPSWIRTES